MDREKILDRARRLYAMSKDKTSENEALIAAEKLAQIQADYEITLSELTAFERKKANPMGFGTYKDERRKTVHPTAWSCAYGISKFTDTVAYKEGATIRFFGEKTDVEMAVYLCGMLAAVSDFEFSRWFNPVMTQGGQVRPKNSFRRGFASRVTERLLKLKKDQAEAMAQKTGRELMVIKAQLVQAKFEEQGIRLRSTSSSYRSHSDARGAGKRAGDKVNLSRPISSGSQRLLG